jgi:hypothetical protein
MCEELFCFGEGLEISLKMALDFARREVVHNLYPTFLSLCVLLIDVTRTHPNFVTN